MNRKNFLSLTASIFFCAALLAGCSKGESNGPGAGPGGAAPPPPSVEVATVGKEAVDILRDYTAELKAAETVEIRTRVGGTLESVHFAEGSMVQQGQVLFQIDPAPYYADIKAAEATLSKAQAGVAQAEGQVAQARGALMQSRANLQKALTQVNLQESKAALVRAEATLQAAEREVRRYRPLHEQGAVPEQRYDQAVDQRDVAKAERDAVKAELTNTGVSDQADVGVARADVASAEANVQSALAAVTAAKAEVQSASNALDTAQLYLEYTTIRAPFTGFIGRLNLDRGTMIVQGNAVLATLSSANPIFVDFAIPEIEYLDLKQRGGFDQAPFTIVLSSGNTYPMPGEFVLTEPNIDAETGTLVVRTRFENPEYLLKPGGYGRISMMSRQLSEALTIPQRAVFSNQSLSSVYVVKADNTVEQRNVILGDRVQDDYVVTEGLQEGETIIVDGLQKVRAGITVAPEKAKVS